ncbi:MAG: RDD family protein [Gammaproteobacteria bacterium]|nr:RDD family protein [Gammaproteobacteria bacterium]MBU1723303.1 RDD family protein [Gammaproteobacteria bacterium]MBU2006598.1 RDD family protein [Gammaproteobacteria bacterium]
MEDNATLLRRLGAIIYDTVLAGFSIIIVAGILSVAFTALTGIKPPEALMVLLYAVMAWGFFIWFWTHGGQTLGMRAWKVRVVTEDGQPVSRQQATLRFFWAILSWAALGVGYLISLIDPQRLTWHDRFSRTRLIRVHSTRK